MHSSSSFRVVLLSFCFISVFFHTSCFVLLSFSLFLLRLHEQKSSFLMLQKWIFSSILIWKKVGNRSYKVKQLLKSRYVIGIFFIFHGQPSPFPQHTLAGRQFLFNPVMSLHGRPTLLVSKTVHMEMTLHKLLIFCPSHFHHHSSQPPPPPPTPPPIEKLPTS